MPSDLTPEAIDAMEAGPEKFWRFTAEADRISPKAVRVKVVTESGQVFVRTGFHPLLELIRILGNPNENRAALHATLTQEARND